MLRSGLWQQGSSYGTGYPCRTTNIGSEEDRNLLVSDIRTLSSSSSLEAGAIQSPCTADRLQFRNRCLYPRVCALTCNGCPGPPSSYCNRPAATPRCFRQIQAPSPRAPTLQMLAHAPASGTVTRPLRMPHRVAAASVSSGKDVFRPLCQTAHICRNWEGGGVWEERHFGCGNAHVQVAGKEGSAGERTGTILLLKAGYAVIESPRRRLDAGPNGR